MVTAAVLAGGKSKRMGRDKLFIEVEGRRLLQRVLDVLEPIFDDIMIVAASAETGESLDKFKWVRHRIVQDLIPEKASMGGLYTALSCAESERVFVTGGDMPFLNKDLIRYIISKDGYDVVVPCTNDRFHPLHAVYSRGCLSAIKDMIYKGDLSITRFISKMKRYEVAEEEIIRFDPGRISLININTPEDLEIIRDFHCSERTGGGKI